MKQVWAEIEDTTLLVGGVGLGALLVTPFVNGVAFYAFALVALLGTVCGLLLLYENLHLKELRYQTSPICIPQRQTITARYQEPEPVSVPQVDRGILVEDWPMPKPVKGKRATAIREGR